MVQIIQPFESLLRLEYFSQVRKEMSADPLNGVFIGPCEASSQRDAIVYHSVSVPGF